MQLDPRVITKAWYDELCTGLRDPTFDLRVFPVQEGYEPSMIVLQDMTLPRTLVAPPAVPVLPTEAPDRFSATRGLSLKEISRRAVLEAERDVIRRALEQCRWNRVKTAKMLRISYRALLYKIKDMGLKQDSAAS